MGGFVTGLVLVAFYKLKTGQAIWTRGDRLRPLREEIAGLGVFIAVFLAATIIIRFIPGQDPGQSTFVIAGVVTWIWAREFMLAGSG